MDASAHDHSFVRGHTWPYKPCIFGIRVCQDWGASIYLHAATCAFWNKQLIVDCVCGCSQLRLLPMLLLMSCVEVFSLNSNLCQSAEQASSHKQDVSSILIRLDLIAQQAQICPTVTSSQRRLHDKKSKGQIRLTLCMRTQNLSREPSHVAMKLSKASRSSSCCWKALAPSNSRLTMPAVDSACRHKV